MEQFAVMNIKEGEELVAAMVSGHISGTGYYKFLAKKTRDGGYEWAHFTERDNGIKEKVFRGETKSVDELQTVLEIMNKNLERIFGSHAMMKQGIPEFRTLMGVKSDNTIN